MAALRAALSALAHCGRGQALGEALSALAHCGRGQALEPALYALAHCRRGQALDHLAEAWGRPLDAVQCSLGRGRLCAVWGETGPGAVSVLGPALGTELCHDSWEQEWDPGLAVMG